MRLTKYTLPKEPSPGYSKDDKLTQSGGKSNKTYQAFSES